MLAGMYTVATNEITNWPYESIIMFMLFKNKFKKINQFFS